MQHDISLRRGNITLRPMEAADAPAFRALVDEGSWAGMSVPLPADDLGMAEHLEQQIQNPVMLVFAVERSGHFVGRTTLYDVVEGLKAEIGNTIYARDVWASEVNPAAKLMLFTHAFEALRMERVALRCDHRNTRSHAAIRRLGATFEGTLRRFRPAADGTIADIDYFSVLREEWPRVRQGLETRLGNRS